jgi:hypothetical protein
MLTNRALLAQDDKKFLMWSEEADNSLAESFLVSFDRLMDQ